MKIGQLVEFVVVSAHDIVKTPVRWRVQLTDFETFKAGEGVVRLLLECERGGQRYGVSADFSTHEISMLGVHAWIPGALAKIRAAHNLVRQKAGS